MLTLRPLIRTWPCRHELARLGAGTGQAAAPHGVVQAPLQHDDQVFARGALGALGLMEIGAELALEQAVGALDLLLFAQLQAVAGGLRAARLAMLAGHEIPLLDGAFLGETPQAFQEQLLPFPAAQPANCFPMSCHFVFSFCFFRIRDRQIRLYAAPLRRTAAVVRNRRDVFDVHDVQSGGGQRAYSGLAAGPGPLTRTSMLFIPY